MDANMSNRPHVAIVGGIPVAMGCSRFPADVTRCISCAPELLLSANFAHLYPSSIRGISRSIRTFPREELAGFDTRMG